MAWMIEALSDAMIVRRRGLQLDLPGGQLARRHVRVHRADDRRGPVPGLEVEKSPLSYASEGAVSYGAARLREQPLSLRQRRQ